MYPCGLPPTAGLLVWAYGFERGLRQHHFHKLFEKESLLLYLNGEDLSGVNLKLCWERSDYWNSRMQPTLFLIERDALHVATALSQIG